MIQSLRLEKKKVSAWVSHISGLEFFHQDHVQAIDYLLNLQKSNKRYHGKNSYRKLI